MAKDVIDRLALPFQVDLSVPMMIGDRIGKRAWNPPSTRQPSNLPVFCARQEIIAGDRPMAVSRSRKKFQLDVRDQEFRACTRVALSIKPPPYCADFGKKTVKNFLPANRASRAHYRPRDPAGTLTLAGSIADRISVSMQGASVGGIAPVGRELRVCTAATRAVLI